MGSSFDCPGPMTLTVEDSALLLKVLAGKDQFDATSSQVKVDDYVSEMKKSRKLTIGVPEEYFEGIEDSLKAKINEAIEVFKKQGHTIKKIKLLSPKFSISVYTILQRAEVSSNLGRYDGVR